MNQLLFLSTGLKQAKLSHSVKNILENEANVLKAEMKKDAATESKRIRVEEIEAQTAQLHKQMIDTLVEVNEQKEDITLENSSVSSSKVKNTKQ